ncbi:MAG: N-acetyltransferase [Rhodospirillaceae bacterium]|nr:N-acetyltransferase [Rhodospirillaceae bacterium]
MPDGSEASVIRVLGSITEIDAAHWDGCAGPDDPFVSHAFLSALEGSGSANAGTGWRGQHLVIEGENGDIVAACPLYLKNHSYGEFVFDWGWADAYQRAGGQYYPKLLAAVPFTPATGRRLLVRPDMAPEQRRSLQAALLSAMMQLAERLGVSSVHINFLPEDEWHLAGDVGMLKRQDKQFHWLNDGYETFDDFLDALASRKRKNIAKERRQVESSGVTIRRLTGADITESHWDTFYGFYHNTSDRKWGEAYLSREFFSMLGERMADRVLLVMAEEDGRAVGGALNMIGNHTLFGRYWGCQEHFKFLHFEVCYYQAIEYAIECGLRRVEAGAQGEHKISRGYLPHPTYSAHWIANPGFRDAVANFLTHETSAVDDEIAALSGLTPFKRGS